MKRISFIILIGWTLSCSLTFGQEVYRWVDERGVVHFTDDLGRVPEKYRDRIQKKEPSQEPSITQPASSPSMETPKGMEIEKRDESTPRSPSTHKDIFGRGEEWWRAKAKEWNGKWIAAQKNYETATNEWKAKERELEASKFKPDSLKRKLKAEAKALEEKAKDWQKQMEEAKDMLEKVLPKQAQDDRANPDWLKIEGIK